MEEKILLNHVEHLYKRKKIQIENKFTIIHWLACFSSEIICDVKNKVQNFEWNFY